MDVRTRAKADIEAYYGGQVTYQYTETNNYRAGMSGAAGARRSADARSRAQSAATTARNTQAAFQETFNDFRRPESRNLTREVYEDKLEILLFEEYLVYSDLGRQWDERARKIL